jgi:hypothetical protein
MDRRAAQAGSMPRWWVDALQTTVSGLVFAVVLATLLVALQAAQVRPLRALEQAGVDAGMWLAAHVDILGRDHAAGRAAAPRRYAFIDVDRAACEAFLDGAPRTLCATDNPARSALVVDLVRALRESGAAVVMVDVAPPPPAAERERAAWRAGLVAASGPWVLAPVAARPSDLCGDGLSLWGERSHDIVPTHAAGRLRLVSVASRLDPDLADGVLRDFPLASRLHLRGEPARWLPTMPMLAALLAGGASAEQIDRAWYGPPPAAVADAEAESACGPAGAQQPMPQPVPARNSFSADPAAGAPPVVRLFFSLPGLSTLQGDLLARVEQQHLAVYERYEASRLLESGCRHRLDAQAEPQPGCFGTRADLFAGKIVAIGSSSATALDRVQTPAGPMSGAEVIVNATRAFAEFPRIRTPPAAAMWLDKITGLLVPTLIALASWSAIYALAGRLRARQQALAARGAAARAFGLRIARALVVVAIFVASMALAAWLEMRGLLQDLAHPDRLAQPVDMLLPIVSMGLDGYVEAAKAAEHLLHRPSAALVGWLLAAGAALAARARAMSASRRTGRKEDR